MVPLRWILGHLVANTLRVTRTLKNRRGTARDAKQGPPRSKGVVPLWGKAPQATQGGFFYGLNLRRKSSVKGNSRLPDNSMVAGGTASLPGVCPIRKKRAMRRLSASYALTGNVL